MFSAGSMIVCVSIVCVLEVYARTAGSRGCQPRLGPWLTFEVLDATTRSDCA